MIPSETRKRIVIANEGTALHNAVANGDAGPEILKAIIDGEMNALIRIEGPKEASVFAYALADRVVGGVREPTPEIEPEQIPLPKLPKIVPLVVERQWLDVLIGMALGTIIMRLWL